MATKKHVPVKAAKPTGKAVAKKTTGTVKPVQAKTAKNAAAPQARKASPPKAPVKSVANKGAKPTAAKAVVNATAKKAVPNPVSKPSSQKTAPKKVATPAPLPLKALAKTSPQKVIQGKKVDKQDSVKIEPGKPVSIKAANPALNIMAKKEENKNTGANAPNDKPTAAKPAAEVKAKDIKVPAPKPVIIPKIATKTVRKYQPEFTKSVLDKAQRDPGAPSQRYSDAELQEFRELIQRKLEAAKKELSYLHGLITRKDEMGGDEGDNRYMTMEDGSLSMEREQLSQMASRQITFIDHLEKAVMRIENKTYGICRVTGKLIDKARLRAVPHATLSIEAKMGGK
jgi:RNA polymerase-binding transcription factor DksA